MVHGQLIKEGKVEKLTYRQVRALEKIDAKKDRDAKLLDLAKSTVSAAGQAGAGVGIGLGNAMNGYLSGDAIAVGIKFVAGALFMIWLATNYPNFARALHLDVFPLHNGIAPTPPAGYPPSGTLTTTPGGGPSPTTTIVPTGKNIYSLPKGTLDTAYSQAAGGNVNACVHTLTSAGGDLQGAYAYCSQANVGEQQL